MSLMSDTCGLTPDYNYDDVYDGIDVMDQFMLDWGQIN